MRMALVQQVATEDKEANREKGLAAVSEAAERGAQIICFAELAFEPFYPQFPAEGDVHSLAEPIPGPTTESFAKKAAELGVVIILNLFERDGADTYDSSPVIDADGTLLGTTRMIHITDYPCFHEQGYYTPGDKGAPVYTTRYGKIGVAICYDRHYPEYMRALAIKGAELVIVPQAGAVDEWPAGLFEAEMRVAAFQNGYYTALCNRVGKEPRVTFAGESFVSDPAGRVIARAGKETEEILYCDLDLEQARTSHARRLFMRDRRPELYSDWLAKKALAYMPLQNRVTPFSEIVSHAARGTFMGNRGCLHDPDGRIVRNHSGKRWIICVLEFKGRRRALMQPGRYTELFFLDEATALAAGHRPCAECQRERFQSFRSIWSQANPELKVGPHPKASEIDLMLHAERMPLIKRERMITCDPVELPTGVMVADLQRTVYLVYQACLLPWSPEGYGKSQNSGDLPETQLLTPPSIVNAIAGGYVPYIHPSAKTLTAQI